MNELTIFHFEEDHEVRTLERDGEPWFVAKDVCDVLGLTNVTEALRNMPDDERNTLSSTEGIHEGPGNPNVNIINEPGVYRLVFQSRKPEAERFKKWVFHEVIPSIRKKGFYATPEIMSRVEQQLGQLAALFINMEEYTALLPRLKALPATIEEAGKYLEKSADQGSWHKPFIQFTCPYYGRADMPAEIEAMIGKMREFDYLFKEASKNIERNRRAPNPAAMGPKKPFNYSISLFVSEHFDFTRKESDVLLVSVAYKVYHCEAEYPVEEAAFARYLSDVYNDLAVTTKKLNGVDTRVITGVRFRSEK